MLSFIQLSRQNGKEIIAMSRIGIFLMANEGGIKIIHTNEGELEDTHWIDKHLLSDINWPSTKKPAYINQYCFGLLCNRKAK